MAATGQRPGRSAANCSANKLTMEAFNPFLPQSTTQQGCNRSHAPQEQFIPSTSPSTQPPAGPASMAASTTDPSSCDSGAAGSNGSPRPSPPTASPAGLQSMAVSDSITKRIEQAEQGMADPISSDVAVDGSHSISNRGCKDGLQAAPVQGAMTHTTLGMNRRRGS
ncbi:unnamed protein product [Urochloa humidicola]